MGRDRVARAARVRRDRGHCAVETVALEPIGPSGAPARSLRLAVVTSFEAVLRTAAYCELRCMVEGRDPRSVAAVFD